MVAVCGESQDRGRRLEVVEDAMEEKLQWVTVGLGCGSHDAGFLLVEVAVPPF